MAVAPGGGEKGWSGREQASQRGHSAKKNNNKVLNNITKHEF